MRTRRRTEAALGTLASVVVCVMFVVAALGASRGHHSQPLWGSAAWLAAVGIAGAAARAAIKRWAPESNEILLGLIGLLLGIGWVFVVRVDPRLAPEHTVAVLAGFAALAATLFLIRRAGTRSGTLSGHPCIWGISAVALAAAGSLGSGSDVSAGAYEAPRQVLSWGALSMQPYGLAKIAVIVAACGFTVSAPRCLGARLIPYRHAVCASAAAIGAWTMLVVQRDFAASVVMFCAAWLPLWLDNGEDAVRETPTAARLARSRALGGIFATYSVGVIVLATVHDQLSAQVRYWLNPWIGLEGAAVVDAAFAIGAGGISGTGPGLGSPQLVRAAADDFVFAVNSDDRALNGGAAVIVAFMLLVGIGATIALRAHGTQRLLAASAAFVIGLQALFAIAGVLRILPHTVGALPFVARGPLALVGNCIAAAMLLAVSDASRGRADSHDAVAGPDYAEVPMPLPGLDEAEGAQLRLKPRRRGRKRAGGRSGDAGEPQELPLGDS